MLLRKTFAREKCETFVRQRTIPLQQMWRSPDALPFGLEQFTAIEAPAML